MKREFNIGDIAHLSNTRKNKDQNNKTVTLKSDCAVKILSYCKMDLSVGGWGYQVEFNGDLLLYEIPQNDFYDKKLWNKIEEMSLIIRKKESK